MPMNNLCFLKFLHPYKLLRKVPEVTQSKVSSEIMIDICNFKLCGGSGCVSVCLFNFGTCLNGLCMSLSLLQN